MRRLFQRLAQLGPRICKIAAFARAGSGPVNMLKMMVVGYARGHTFSGPGVVSRVGRTLFPLIVVKPSALNCLSLYLDPSDLSHLVATDEVLIDQVYPLDQVPFEPDVIIDCGANIGVFTLLASGRFPGSRVIAFEPDPKNAIWLRKHVESNALAVEIMEAAVSTREGVESFESGLGVASALTKCKNAGENVISVRTIQLSRFISRIAPKRLLLKLDVEGAEERLFPDIIDILPRDCSIFFETHGGEKAWNQARQLLEKAEFSVTVMRRRSVYVEAHALRVSAEIQI